jgi:hypothetical protein
MEKTNYETMAEIKQSLIELINDLEKMLQKEPTLREYGEMHACAVRAAIAADDLMQIYAQENCAKDVELGTFASHTLQ